MLGRGGVDAAIGAEVGEEGLEAVHRQTVCGASGGLLAVGGVGALGPGDDAGALGCSSLVIGLIESIGASLARM
jgi:hypothetical protein